MALDIQEEFMKTILTGAMVAMLALPAGAGFAQDGGLDGKIAAITYTLRDAGDVDAQLAAVQAAGISHVETFGDHWGLSAEEARAKLDEYGIQVISSHVSYVSLRDDLEGQIAFHTTLGNNTLTVPNLPGDVRPTDAEGWRAMGEELNGIAAELAEHDMRLAYHNHADEMAVFDGTTALEIMLEAAPDVLAEVDVAWAARGGQDPAELLGRLGDRVFAIHAKDNAPEGENEDQRGFADVGSGVLDWDAIIETAEDIGIEWYIIEHDMPLDAGESIANSADFLRSAR